MSRLREAASREARRDVDVTLSRPHGIDLEGGLLLRGYVLVRFGAPVPGTSRRVVHTAAVRPCNSRLAPGWPELLGEHAGRLIRRTIEEEEERMRVPPTPPGPEGPATPQEVWTFDPPMGLRPDENSVVDHDAQTYTVYRADGSLAREGRIRRVL